MPAGAAGASIDAKPQKEDSMATRRRTPADLSLAPVAANIDANLARLRDRAREELDFELALVLDRPERDHTPQERARRVLEVAVRNVEMHGWTPSISDDHSRLHLAGGSVSIDLGLGAAVMRYIDGSA